MRIAKYFIVGGISALVDLGVFTLLIAMAEWHYLLAAPVGFLLATCLNYQLSIRHVFESGVRFNKRNEIGLVFVVSAIGLLINQGVLFLAVEHLQSNPILAKIAATGFVFFWNYGARSTFIFRDVAARQ